LQNSGGRKGFDHHDLSDLGKVSPSTTDYNAAKIILFLYILWLFAKYPETTHSFLRFGSGTKLRPLLLCKNPDSTAYMVLLALIQPSVRFASLGIGHVPPKCKRECTVPHQESIL